MHSFLIPLFLVNFLYCGLGFPGGSEVKASACNAGDLGSIPGSGSSPGEGNGNPLQYSCLENPKDGGAWWALVHGVTKSRTQLSDFTSLRFTIVVQSLSCVQLFETPWTVVCQNSLSVEFCRQEYWSELSFPSPGDLPDPGIKLCLLHCRWILYPLSHLGNLYLPYKRAISGSPLQGKPLSQWERPEGTKTWAGVMAWGHSCPTFHGLFQHFLYEHRKSGI